MLAVDPAAFSADIEPQPVARKILALYDGSIEPTPAETRIHRWAEMPLNHLGYIVAYHDVRAPLPSVAAMRDFAGLITWFSRAPSTREAYLDWAAAIIESGKRIAILGSAGGDDWSADLDQINKLLAPMGMRHTGQFVDLTFDTAIAHSKVGFEARLDPVLPTYPVVRITHPNAESLLELAVPARDGGGKSVVAAVGPAGGFVAAGFDIIVEPRLDRVRWLINPFRFFKQAFGAADGDWPRPDITTRSGRRIFFSHVDLSHVHPERQGTAVDQKHESKSSLQVLLDEIVRSYPDIPMTLAVMPSIFETTLGSGTSPRKLIEEILKSESVEPAILSCARSRPSRYNRGSDPSRGQNGSATEIASALYRARSLVGSEDSVRLYQWDSEARPLESELVVRQKLGLFNMGGDKSRMDSDYASIAYIRPISQPVGAERLFYPVIDGGCGAVADRPVLVGALRGMRTTISNTESPRRISGFNLHYQVSLFDEWQALEAVKSYLDEVRSGRFSPIREAEYATMAKDFFDVEVSRVSPSTWLVTKLGSVHTLRFDNVDEIQVDLARSQGVVGQARSGGSVYVTLDSAKSTALVALVRDPADRASLAGLQESRWSVSNLVRRGCGWAFSASGFGPGEFVWFGVEPGDVEIVARSTERIWAVKARSDADGRLSFVVPGEGFSDVAIEVHCGSDREGTPR